MNASNTEAVLLFINDTLLAQLGANRINAKIGKCPQLLVARVYGGTGSAKRDIKSVRSSFR
jgi:hypothetical protein